MQTVLLVDDDPRILNALNLVLLGQGILAEMVENGQAALDYLKKNRPDMIITDITMPGIDGRDLCRRIRQDADFCEMPIIVISGCPECEERGWTASIGRLRYLEKPVKLSVLLEIVTDFFRKGSF